ncbi:MAG: hypothetical protein K6U80_00975 [Firmicutes bacterium]|nr:hypothetical protein [Bacillota bacterium]
MLKPVDLQTVMPRSVDLQRIQQIDHNRPAIQQQEETRESVKQAQLRQEIVQTNEAAAGSNRIHEREGEQRGGHNRRYNRFHNKSDKKLAAEEEKAAEGYQGPHIDIKM